MISTDKNKANLKLIFWILAILLAVFGTLTLVLSGAPALILDPDPESDLGSTPGSYVLYITY